MPEPDEPEPLQEPDAPEPASPAPPISEAETPVPDPVSPRDTAIDEYAPLDEIDRFSPGGTADGYDALEPMWSPGGTAEGYDAFEDGTIASRVHDRHTAVRADADSIAARVHSRRSTAALTIDDHSTPNVTSQIGGDDFHLGGKEERLHWAGTQGGHDAAAGGAPAGDATAWDFCMF